MTPLHIPIRLADNSIAYSSGVGTVVFNPIMMHGKPWQPVEFTRVLHVPLLQNNLLSCLCLARHKHIIIHIDSEQMDFSLNGKSLFSAPIRSDNCAVPSGSSEPLSESANWASLVTGMTFASSHKPDFVHGLLKWLQGLAGSSTTQQHKSISSQMLNGIYKMTK